MVSDSATRASSGLSWTGAVHAAGRLARGGEHDHPQAGSVPRRPRLRRRARAAACQPHRPGALARAQSRRGRQPGYCRQPGAGPGNPDSGYPRQTGAGRVLRLPVLRGAAPGRSRHPAPRRRQEDTVSQRIEDALNAGTGITHSSPRAKASGYTHRRHRPRPCPRSVREPARSPAHSPRKPGPAARVARHAGTRSYRRFRSSEGI